MIAAGKGDYVSNRVPFVLDTLPEAFDKEKQGFLAATDKLQAAVAGKDKAQIATAYEAVHDSCKSCHKQFKVR